MNNTQLFKLYCEEARRHWYLKKTCDSCIPDELIEMDKVILNLILSTEWQETLKPYRDDIYEAMMEGK